MFFRAAWHCQVFHCLQKNYISQATVFQCVSYNCSMTKNGTVCINVRFKWCTASKNSVFPWPGIQEKTMNDWPSWLFQENLYTSSAGQWGLFFPENFPQTFPVLVLPSSCCGVSCQWWQLHRIMTHASCACQMRLDSWVQGSVIHGTVFTAQGDVLQILPIKISVRCFFFF